MKKHFIIYTLITCALLPLNPAGIYANTHSLKTERKCKKPVKARGPGNTLASVAELKAIIIWSDKVSKAHDSEHANWHNAKSKSLKCKKQTNSNYFYCELKATPCIQQPIKEEPETGEKPADNERTNASEQP